MGLSQLFPNALGPCFLCPTTLCVALVVPRLKPSKALGIVGEACLLLGLRFADVCQRWLSMKLLLCPRLRPDSAVVQGLNQFSPLGLFRYGLDPQPSPISPTLRPLTGGRTWSLSSMPRCPLMECGL